MAKVNPENQIEVTQANLTLILKEYGVHSFTFEVFNQGIANTSIKIITSDKIYVLRAYCHGRKSDKDILLELEFQDYLRTNNLPVPVIYKNQQDKELSQVKVGERTWQVLLMEYKSGNNSSEYSDNLLIELAQIQAKMHILGIEFSKSIKEHDSVVKEMYDTMWPTKQEVIVPNGHDPEIKTFMQRARAMHIKINPELPHGYNHLDIDFDGNVLIKEGHISAILDFDDLSYSACIICLGYTMWHILFATNDWEKVHFYLKEYLKVRDLTQLELATLPEIILFRNYVLGIIEFALHKNYERVDRIVGLEKSIKEAKFNES